jgi:acyl carrier protein
VAGQIINWNFITTKRRVTMAVESKMIDIIVEQLSVDKDKVVVGASFVDDLGADSLDLVELIMAMEEEFDVEIPDEEAEKIASVQDAIDFVNKLQA